MLISDFQLASSCLTKKNHQHKIKRPNTIAEKLPQLENEKKNVSLFLRFSDIH